MLDQCLDPLIYATCQMAEWLFWRVFCFCCCCFHRKYGNFGLVKGLKIAYNALTLPTLVYLGQARWKINSLHASFHYSFQKHARLFCLPWSWMFCNLFVSKQKINSFCFVVEQIVIKNFTGAYLNQIYSYSLANSNIQLEQMMLFNKK